MAQVFVVVAAGSVIAFIIRDLGEASISGVSCHRLASVDAKFSKRIFCCGWSSPPEITVLDDYPLANPKSLFIGLARGRTESKIQELISDNRSG